VSYYADPAFSNCPNTIEIIKSVNTAEASAGEILTYTISVTSFYNVDITNVVVVDTLSASLDYVAGSLTCGSASNDTLSINFGTIMPDSTRTCTFEARTDPLSFGQIQLNDDFEMGTADWTVDNIEGAKIWSLSTFNANSPTHSYFTPNRGQEQNTQAIVTDPISISEDAVFSFYHLYNLEFGRDGGLVEISTDNGASWADLGSAMTQNGYNSTLNNDTNPNIANRPAFTGNSGAFVQTVIDLSSYADSIVLIRFLFGEDNSIGSLGWFIDDVKLSSVFSIYNQACVTYDQGDAACTANISTAILNCADDIATYLDVDGVLTLDTADLSTSSFGADADTVYFLIKDYDCAGAAVPFNNAAVAVTGSDTAYCSFRVISVTDTIAPMAICTDITIYLDSMGMYTLSDADSMALISSASDNCAIGSVSFSNQTFNCVDGPVSFIEVSFTDINGLSSSCDAQVAVLDTIGPTLTCVDMTVYVDSTGQYSFGAMDSALIIDMIDDGCGAMISSLSKSSFTCTDMPSTNVVLTASDPSSNTSTCMITVTVLDTIAPILSCSALTLDLPMDRDTVVNASQFITSISDNCTIDTTYLSIDTLNCTHAGTDVTVVLTAEDLAGNQATCTIDITVTDTHGYCCPDTLIVAGMPIPTLDYYGSDLIRSEGQIGDGIPVNFRSQTVLLDTTFAVDVGGVLQVINEDCNN